jgi:hypothetical protein
MARLDFGDSQGDEAQTCFRFQLCELLTPATLKVDFPRESFLISFLFLQ